MITSQPLLTFRAMNVETNELAHWAQGESQCRVCHGPWFGLVTYCPYCGQRSGFAVVEPEPDDDADPAAAPLLDGRASGRERNAVAAGLAGLLVLSMLVALAAHRTDEAASPSAAPTPPIPSPIEAVAPTAANRSALCSAASEQAGLCIPER